MWHLWHTIRRQGQNFGGTETWWEATMMHDDGRESFGAGPTRAAAIAQAKADADHKDNPPAPLPHGVDQDGNPMPF